MVRSEEHTSELQSRVDISYAVFCLKKKKSNTEVEPLTTGRERRRPHQAPSPACAPLSLGLHLSILPGPVRGRSAFLAFFFNDRATTEIYPLSLHAVFPI